LVNLNAKLGSKASEAAKPDVAAKLKFISEHINTLKKNVTDLSKKIEGLKKAAPASMAKKADVTAPGSTAVAPTTPVVAAPAAPLAKGPAAVAAVGGEPLFLTQYNEIIKR